MSIFPETEHTNRFEFCLNRCLELQEFQEVSVAMSQFFLALHKWNYFN